MNAIGYLGVFVGLIVFLIGYWFLAESQGQCTGTDTTVANASAAKGGGIAGIVIGMIIMILGIVFGNSSETPE